MTLEDSLQVGRGSEAATARILRITRELLDNRARGVTVAHPDGARLVSAESYRSVDVVEAERAHLFRRLPLAVATSADLREVGSYITRDLAGVPTLVTRGSDGVVRAFLNSCVHRGIEVAQGDGTVRGRFVCRYHGWSYDDRGTLVAVAQADTVGDVDVGCRGLREFQCEERHGLVFVQVDTGAPMDLSAHLGAFEPVIESMGLQDMVCAAKRQLHHEVNWKIALLGYYENYHVGYLHRDSIAPGLIPNLAVYERFDRHGIIYWASKNLLEYEDTPEADWPDLIHESPPFHAVGFIYPNVVLNVFGLGAGEHMNFDFTYPGAHPGVQRTDWTIYRRDHDSSNPDHIAWAEAHVERVFGTLEHEDYDTIVEAQRAIDSGLVDDLMLAANEQMLIDMTRAWSRGIGVEPSDVAVVADG